MTAPNDTGWRGTPGKWHVVSDREDELRVRSDENDFIADCADGFWSDETEGWIMAPDSEANAQGIAALPDLIEAAQLGLSVAERWINDELSGTGEMLDQALAELEPIRAALSKALGTGEAR